MVSHLLLKQTCFHASITGSQSEISLGVTEMHIHDLNATIRSPTGLEEACLLKKLANNIITKNQEN